MRRNDQTVASRFANIPGVYAVIVPVNAERAVGR